MAEELGVAELRITLNDSEARAALQALRQEIEGLNRRTSGAGSRTSTRVSSGSGGSSITPATQVSSSVKAAQASERLLSEARSKTARETSKAIEAERRAAGQRTSSVISNALIGGAFPLLFGQGAGASFGGLLGGGLGGLAGGTFGFGGSLIGTAIGAQVDAAVQKLQTLGTALNDPIGSFGELQQAALLSSRGVEKNVEALIAAGRTEEAAAAIRLDLAQTFGDVTGAEELKSSLDELGRNFSQLGVSLVQELSPALISATQGLSEFIAKLSLIPARNAGETIQQAKSFIGSDATRQQEFDRLFAAEGGTYGASGKFSSDSIGAALRASIRFLEINGQITQQQEQQQQAQNEINAAKQRSAELSAIEAQIIVANVQGDSERVLELERQKLALQEIAALNAAPDNNTTQREQIKLEFAQRRLAVEEQLRNLPNDGSIGQLQQSLQKLESTQLKFDVDSTAFRDATVDIIATRDQLQQLDGQKAVIEAEVITKGLENGLVQLTQSNLQNLANSLQTALQNAPFGSEAFQGIRDASILAQQALEEGSNKIQFAAVGVRDAGQALAQGGTEAARAVNGASRELRGLLEGNFNLLRPELRQQVLQNALGRVNFNLVDRNALQSPSDVFAAARLSEQLSGTTSSLGALKASLDGLSNKDWRVDVDVNTGGSGNLTYMQKPNLG